MYYDHFHQVIDSDVQIVLNPNKLKTYDRPPRRNLNNMMRRPRGNFRRYWTLVNKALKAYRDPFRNQFSHHENPYLLPYYFPQFYIKESCIKGLKR